MNDSVREELQTKIAPVSVSGQLGGKATRPPLATPQKLAPPPQNLPPRLPSPQPDKKPDMKPVLKPSPPRVVTSDLSVKKTSPTLVGFQPRNAAVPDWRLELQNAIRQRTKPVRKEPDADAQPVLRRQRTHGANALKENTVADEKPVEHENPRVANALKRIENSRRAFQPAGDPTVSEPQENPINSAKNYPFNVVTPTGEPSSRKQEPRAAAVQKPRLVSSLRIEKRGFDTNKLPPLPKPAKIESSFDLSISVPTGDLEPAGEKAENSSRILIGETATASPIDDVQTVEPEVEEEEIIDDLAPVSMRFGAGLFDVMIGGFGGLALLSPFIVTGGDWMSFSGILAVTAAGAIVLWIYLTASVAFFGRTVGMRLFSLELVDSDSNGYPTLHQAAVNSAVFILSMSAAGLGFLPMLFNEERRTAHDMLSNTILVREI